MGNQLHMLDPDGDIELLVVSQGMTVYESFLEASPVATRPILSLDHDSSQSLSTSLENSLHNGVLGSQVNKNGQQQTADQKCPQPEVEMSIIVSSKHLTLASPYFRRLLIKGDSDWEIFNEFKERGFARVRARLDKQALLTVMNIIHGRIPLVPRKLDLDALTNIAVVVDRYDCKEAIEIFLDIWTQKAEAGVSTTYSESIVKWICIAWVFRKRELFKKVTQIAVSQADDLIWTKLPIPYRILENINERRIRGIDQCLEQLHGLLENLRNSNSCSPECQSILLGSIIKEMDFLGFQKLQEDISFRGYSLSGTAKLLQCIKSPVWYDGPRKKLTHCETHGCSLKPFMVDIVDTLREQMDGLLLEDFL